MNDLSKYLDRYRNLTPPNASTIKLLVKTIHDECGVDLTESSVSLHRGSAVVSCHPAVRSEVVRCAPQVITTLQKKHGIRLTSIR